ncbi:hypothetical protein [Nocardioides kribbensis]|uniref:Uncharacterized protein n=1 Tax=Nocardioides kribbensis TaxID=305517 RepID=A0ABV1NUK0_9ACTN
MARDRVASEVTSGYVPTGGFDPFLFWINTPVSDCDEGGPHEFIE